MPKAFDFSNPPFDRLTPGEAERLRESLDIVYFRPGEAIIAKGALANALYVVIKGTVEERADAEIALPPGFEPFDTRMYGDTKLHFLRFSR